MFALARAEIPPNGDTLAPLEKLNKGLKEYISHTKVMKKIKHKFRLNDEYTATSTPSTSSAEAQGQQTAGFAIDDLPSSAGAQGQQTAGAQDQEIAEAQDQETAEAQGQETAGFAGGDVPFMLDELDDEWNNLLNFNNTDFMAPGSG
ncbi:hypothetical protein DBV05_g11998 [Lasiodiplodia theobromae]|uniref:Uncharacterized protein n=1 Tax=Lasiodiplodia theobromae TaxID=45133 RepID=A0A5N5CVE3_9PEZI|nr:hypothetical protein DBV05_g11998 [Lasiodiplodia theobromae]